MKLHTTILFYLLLIPVLLLAALLAGCVTTDSAVLSSEPVVVKQRIAIVPPPLPLVPVFYDIAAQQPELLLMSSFAAAPVQQATPKPAITNIALTVTLDGLDVMTNANQCVLLYTNSVVTGPFTNESQSVYGKWGTNIANVPNAGDAGFQVPWAIVIVWSNQALADAWLSSLPK